MKNILVTVDFEYETKVLLAKATEIAQKFNSKIWLIHVAVPNPDYIDFETGPKYMRDFDSLNLTKEHELINQYSEQITKQNIECEGLVIQGATEEMILEESKKLNIELLIIGHHKHNLLYKIFIENTEDNIINNSQIPVLVVPFH